MSLGPISLRSRRNVTSFVWIESSARAWKKSESLTRTSLPDWNEHLEELVLLVARDAGPAQRVRGARRGRFRPAETPPPARRPRAASLRRQGATAWEASRALSALGRDDALGASDDSRKARRARRRRRRGCGAPRGTFRA